MVELPTPEEDFEYFVKSPIQWLGKGQNLYRAATHLFERYKEATEATPTLDGVKLDDAIPFIVDQRFFEPAGLLAGFSIEVTIKAAIVAKFPERIKPGMKGSDWFGEAKGNGHDLKALAGAAGLDVVDEGLLEMLTEFSIWKGRYPSNLEGTPMYGMQTKIENLAGTHWLGLIGRFERTYYGIRDQVNAVLESRMAD